MASFEYWPAKIFFTIYVRRHLYNTNALMSDFERTNFFFLGNGELYYRCGGGDRGKHMSTGIFCERTLFCFCF